MYRKRGSSPSLLSDHFRQRLPFTDTPPIPVPVSPSLQDPAPSLYEDNDITVIGDYGINKERFNKSTPTTNATSRESTKTAADSTNPISRASPTPPNVNQPSNVTNVSSTPNTGFVSNPSWMSNQAHNQDNPPPLIRRGSFGSLSNVSSASGLSDRADDITGDQTDEEDWEFDEIDYSTLRDVPTATTVPDQHLQRPPDTQRRQSPLAEHSDGQILQIPASPGPTPVSSSNVRGRKESSRSRSPIHIRKLSLEEESLVQHPPKMRSTSESSSSKQRGSSSPTDVRKTKTVHRESRRDSRHSSGDNNRTSRNDPNRSSISTENKNSGVEKQLQKENAQEKIKKPRKDKEAERAPQAEQIRLSPKEGEDRTPRPDKETDSRKEKERASNQEKERKAQREKEREAQREKEREAQREKEREAQREKERETQREKEREAQREKERVAQQEKEREAQREKERVAQQEKEREAQLEKERETRREKEREARREKDRQARREKERVVQQEKEREAQREKERVAQQEKEREAQREKERVTQQEKEREAQREKERVAQQEKEREAQLEKERETRREKEREARREKDRQARREKERDAQREKERKSRQQKINDSRHKKEHHSRATSTNNTHPQSKTNHPLSNPVSTPTAIYTKNKPGQSLPQNLFGKNKDSTNIDGNGRDSARERETGEFERYPGDRRDDSLSKVCNSGSSGHRRNSESQMDTCRSNTSSSSKRRSASFSSFEFKEAPPIRTLSVEDVLYMLHHCPFPTCPLYNQYENSRAKSRKHFEDAHFVKHCEICFELMSTRDGAHLAHFLDAHADKMSNPQKAPCAFCRKPYIYTGMYLHLTNTHIGPDPVSVEKRKRDVDNTTSSKKIKPEQFDTKQHPIVKVEASYRPSSARAGTSSQSYAKGPVLAPSKHSHKGTSTYRIPKVNKTANSRPIATERRDENALPPNIRNENLHPQGIQEKKTNAKPSTQPYQLGNRVEDNIAHGSGSFKTFKIPKLSNKK